MNTVSPCIRPRDPAPTGAGREARARRRSAPWLAGGALAAFAFLALLAPRIVPHAWNAQDVTLRLQPPAWLPEGAWAYPLGTDHLGRDVLSRLMYGARATLLVGLATVSLGAFLGGTVGVLGGYAGRWIDSLLMRCADVQLSFPYLLLTLGLIAVIGPGLTSVIAVLGVASWPAYARVVRSVVLSVKRLEYVEAARALGASDGHIVVQHIVPSVLPPLLVVTTLQVSQMMVAEASLSFLGLGVPLATPTWGGMLNEGQSYLFNAWWISAFPGLALTLVVIAVNFLGDRLGEAPGQSA